MFSKKDDESGRAHRLAAIRRCPNRVPEPPAEADLAIARAAASEVLAKGGKDTSMPWENPQTGARGTITPLTSAYSQDGATCRDFLASYVKNGLGVAGCRARPAAPSVANGKCAACGRGRRREASE